MGCQMTPRCTSGHVVVTVLFPVCCCLALTGGCGKGTSKSPPQQQVRDAVAAALPPVLSLDSVELELIATGPESAKINFKAVAVPKEDLCEVDRAVDGTPRITLLTVVQRAGTKVSLYGSIDARRTMDVWTLRSAQIQTGLDQLGKPRGAFDAQAYVTGSGEALAALKQQAANAEIHRQERDAAKRGQAADEKAAAERREVEEKARAEREERARIVAEKRRAAIAEDNRKSEEKRKEDQEAARQKILLATVQGTHYSGTATTKKKDFMRIALVITEQDEKQSLIRARILNPDNRRWWRNLVGELHFEKGATYPIVLIPDDSDEEKQTLRNRHVGATCGLKDGVYLSQWDGENALKLQLADDGGLEGEVLKNRRDLGETLGFGGEGLTIRLTRVEGTSPLPKKDSADAPKTPRTPSRR